TTRQTEFALRIALGASRGRLGLQLLGEATVLAVVGGVAGTGLAGLGLTLWRTWGPSDFPQLPAVWLNGAVFRFALLVSAVTALACGILPSVVARDVAQALHSMTRTITAVRRQARVRRTFVAMQVAAATVLLVGVGVAAKGFARLEEAA